VIGQFVVFLAMARCLVRVISGDFLFFFGGIKDPFDRLLRRIRQLILKGWICFSINCIILRNGTMFLVALFFNKTKYNFMIFFILSIFLLVISVVIGKVPNYAAFTGMFRFGAAALFLIAIATACFVQVDAGYVGVKKLFGKVQPDYLESLIQCARWQRST
jgi:hypothetical protein